MRSTGSGATGATNVIAESGSGRLCGHLHSGCGKGTLAVLLAERLAGGDPRWIAASSVAAILGHCFPVWLKFRGGKGVATGVGVFLALAPVQVALVLVIFAIVVAIWRYISLGSIVATAAFPLLVYYMKHPPLADRVGRGGRRADHYHHAPCQYSEAPRGDGKQGGTEKVRSRQAVVSHWRMVNCDW